MKLNPNNPVKELNFSNLTNWCFRQKYRLVKQLTLLYLHHKQKIKITDLVSLPIIDVKAFIIAMDQLINNLDPQNYQAWKKIFVQNYQWRCFSSNYSDYYKNLNQLFAIILPAIQHKLLSPVQIKSLFYFDYYVG